jgi:hypothetical protein
MNPFEKVADAIGHGVEVATKDVVKGVEYIVTDGEKLIRVVADAKQLSPQFKAELKTLMDDAKPIAEALAPVVATGGKDLAADILAVQPVIKDVVKLGKDVLSFLPILEAAYKQLDADLSSN